MASSIALKRLVSSNLLPTSLLRRSFAVAQPASSRLFNTNALRECDGDDRDVDVDRRVYSPLSEIDEIVRKYEGILYPKRISSSLSQTQNVMDQSTESPVTSSSLRQTQNVMDQSMESPVTSSSLSQTQNVMDQSMESPVTSNIRRKEANDGLHLRMDMPGLGKEDVKVSVEQNTLVIKGEGGNKEGEDDFDGKKYTSRIDLPDRLYKPNEIKAEMKNGVLKVFVPRTDVFQVSVE